MNNSPSSLFCDLDLARRIERSEARANAGFVEARAKHSPGCGATWIEVGGTYAMFDTPVSPVTQTFGLGLFQPATPARLDRIEVFFRERKAPVFHEVSPLAGNELVELLHQRGYRPLEFTSVLVRPVAELSLPASEDARLSVRPMEQGEESLFAEVSAQGWGNTPELVEFVRDFGRIGVQRADTYTFFAEWEGRPIATGSICLHEGVALLAGASTVPAARNRGAQWALLDARLRLAARKGCDLALMGALPGSGSQRNAERHGFKIAYTRLKWQLGT